jgi:hypothetical protein
LKTRIGFAAAGVVALSCVVGIPAQRAWPFATPIQHIVYIIEENHSFDSLLGAWCVQAQRCDGATVGKLYGGASHPLGDSANQVPNVDHSTATQTADIDSGKMDGFSLSSGCHASGGYQCLTQYRPGDAGIANLLGEIVKSCG